MNRAAVGIGANIEPEKHIAEARRLLRELCAVLAESRLVRTAPLGAAGQPDFLNGVILIETPLDASGFKLCLRGIEARLYRQRNENPNAPRTIDLDILVWNGEVVDPDVCERAFLREGLAEVGILLDK